jgi:O-antigen ligase
LGKAMLSCGIIGLTTCAIVNPNVTEHLKVLRNDRMALWGIIVWCVYFISGLWSENKSYFGHMALLHLPLVLIPIGLSAIKQITIKHIQYLLTFFVLLTVIGSIYSAQFIFSATSDVLDLYRTGKSAITPFKNDHIRFSIAVVLSLLFLQYLFRVLKQDITFSNKNIVQSKSWKQKTLVFLIGIIALWFIIYLHLLAAKTGLACLYLIVTYQIFELIKKGHWKTSVLLLMLMFSTPMIAYKYSDTFRTKVEYLKFTLDNLKNQVNDTEISDEGRIISYKLAIHIAKKNLFFGIGAGDIKDKMEQAYLEKIGSKNVKTLLPHNQFLVMLLVGGIPAILIFLFFILVPSTTIPFRKFPLLKYFWLVMWVPLLVEPLHEAQISLTLHLFFLFLLNKLAQKTVTAL